MTLVSISVTPPTKTAYTTNDRQLDLTGMVITATYSDQSTQVITEGYDISNVDFSTAGEKTVTVTYQEKSDSFTITVTEEKPNAWTADLEAAFAAGLYGYVPPFFYGPDLGYGELEWYASKTGDEFYALGATLAAAGEGEDSPLKPVADIMLADGFVASTVPNNDDPEDPDYYYIMDKAVTYETKQRYIQVRIAMVDSQGRFSASGQFYFEISDAYYYSWADTGFEAEIKEAMKFTEDIPDLPDGIRYLKRYNGRFAEQAKYGYAAFIADGADETYVNSCISVLKAANWNVFGSTREEYDVEAISPEQKIRLAFALDDKTGELTVYFDETPIRPDNVKTVAAIFEVSPFAFAYSDKNGNFFYQFNGLALEDGEDWGTLIDEFAATLMADEGTSFVKKGERNKSSENWYDEYVDAQLGIRVVIFAYDYKEGTCGVQITVDEYADIPAQFLPAMTLLNVNTDDVNVVPATETASAYAVYKAKSDPSVAYADALKVYTDILDADGTFKVIVKMSDEKMESGEPCKYVEYASDNVRLMFLAWTTEDDPEDPDDAAETIVQIVFYDYTPAPTTQWLETVLSILNDLELSWDDQDQSFGMAEYRNLGRRETLDTVVQKYANKLLDEASLELELLLDSPSDSTDQYPEAKMILFSDNGSVEIKYGQGYGDLHAPVFFVTVRLFNPDDDAYVNGVAALTGVTFKDNGDGTFSGVGTLKFSGGPYSLTQYGQTLLRAYIAEDLEASSLGFGAPDSEGMSGNDYVGVYTNNKGYTVTVTVLGDANKNYTGNYRIEIVAPKA